MNKKKEYLPSVFIPAKNKGLLKIEETEEKTPSTFEQIMGIGSNLKMALFDCKFYFKAFEYF